MKKECVYRNKVGKNHLTQREFQIWASKAQKTVPWNFPTANLIQHIAIKSHTRNTSMWGVPIIFTLKIPLCVAGVFCFNIFTSHSHLRIPLRVECAFCCNNLKSLSRPSVPLCVLHVCFCCYAFTSQCWIENFEKINTKFF